MAEDSFRAHMSYPFNYFQAQIQLVLEDQRTLGIFLGDGPGSNLNKTSSEDFLTLNGIVHKLDVTKLVEADDQDMMSVKYLKSV